MLTSDRRTERAVAEVEKDVTRQFENSLMSLPNVLLVIMDSVRARNTSLHGYRRETTPFLSDLSTTSTQHTEARAPSQWSLPSHTSIFTGLHVPEHDVTADGNTIRPGSTVFDDLRDRGYETGVFSSNPYLTSLETGLDSGFDTVEGAVQEPPFDGVNPDEYKGELGTFLRDSATSGRPVRSIANGVISKLAWDYPTLIPERLKRNLASGNTPGSTYTDLFCRWTETVSGPWAACINYMDAHHPYTPQSEFDHWDDGSIASVQQSIRSMPLSFYTRMDPWWKCEVLEHLYDGTIRQIDHEINRLVEFLRKRGSYDETLLIVTSDHGEGFGEPSNVRDIKLAGHNVGENEANLHVPLLVKHPDQAESASDDTPVTLTAIPDVIHRAVDGTDGPYDLSHRRVVARTQGLRDVQQHQLRERGIDLTPFQNQADILYEEDDGTVTKRTNWNGTYITTTCFDVRTTDTTGDGDCSSVDAVFDSFADAGIKREQGPRAIDEETEQRLEHLGYR